MPSSGMCRCVAIVRTDVPNAPEYTAPNSKLNNELVKTEKDMWLSYFIYLPMGNQAHYYCGHILPYCTSPG
jgi:hypothetical protein